MGNNGRNHGRYRNVNSSRGSIEVVRVNGYGKDDGAEASRHVGKHAATLWIQHKGMGIVVVPLCVRVCVCVCVTGEFVEYYIDGI